MSATKRDYYQVLGVARDADQRAIKSAYRKLAVRYHPDRNQNDPEAEATFKEAAEAYAVLSDPQRRARYDRFGHQGMSGRGFSGFDPETFGDFADILGDFFGVGLGDFFAGGGRRGGPRPGADLRYQLALTLEEAAFGKETVLEIPRLETCDDCRGSGSAAGMAAETCSACAGRGQVRTTQGFFTVARTCPQCGGEGSVVTDPCRTCGGEGRVQRTRDVRVRIPPGVDTGTRLRRVGEGEHGRRGGPPGDLFVDITVRPDDRFHREGPHVLSLLPVSYPQAVLGATVQVDTLHGTESLEIPPGTPSGKQLRLRGKGIAKLRGGGIGDHVVEVRLEVPHSRDLTKEQEELLRRLAESEGREVRGDRGVLDKVRDLFG